jgi:hypothetical protein
MFFNYFGYKRNNGNVNVVILLDLKKAFDVVDHDIMARKLEIYGFNEKAFAVFNSYMTSCFVYGSLCLTVNIANKSCFSIKKT